MIPVQLRLRRLAPVLVILGAIVIAQCSGGSAVEPSIGVTASAPGSAKIAEVYEPQAARLDLSAVESKRHRDQILRVVAAMDATGRPPQGVFQGGRRGGARGVFVNAEGRLPRQPRGYWVESDVWPRNGRRDAERLVFGGQGEVYWSRDHYETFVRQR